MKLLFIILLFLLVAPGVQAESIRIEKSDTSLKESETSVTIHSEEKKEERSEVKVESKSEENTQVTVYTEPTVVPTKFIYPSPTSTPTPIPTQIPTTPEIVVSEQSFFDRIVNSISDFFSNLF